MIPIKIQCECGQRYAFDVEPVDGRIPSSVACPSCGADGTAAANAAIAQTIATPATGATPGGTRLRVSVAAQPEPSASPAQGPRGGGLLPGQVDRTRAEQEARAKISWGDPPSEVIKYLMIQGFTHDEASSLVEEMFRERTATVRGNGIRNIVVGSGMVCVPIVSLVIFLVIGVIYLKLLGLAIMVGLWGGWKIIRGIFMLVAPKSEHGDVADQ